MTAAVYSETMANIHLTTQWNMQKKKSVTFQNVSLAVYFTMLS
jgi:hypothetical protein